MWGADHFHLFVAGRDMIQRLKLTKELVLVIRVLNDDLDKVNVLFNDTDEKVITLLEATSRVFLL